MAENNLVLQPQLFVGIDIARNTATCATASSLKAVGKPFTFPQTPGGFTELKTILLAQQPDPAHCLVVMEATGTYWMKLALDLFEADFKLSVINPN